MHSLLSSRRRRSAVITALTGAGALAVAMWQLQGAQAAKEAVPSALVTKGSITVTVGGVGRVVAAGPSGAIQTPGAGGTAAEASANAVFPRSSGHVSKVLVRLGDSVKTDEPVIVIDDRGAASRAFAQARDEVTASELELKQKQTSDPNRGLPATPAELRAANAAIASTQARLKQLLRPPSQIDWNNAKADVRKAEADLALLLQPTLRPLRANITAAEAAVTAARSKLKRLTRVDPIASATAEADLAKALADLWVLQRPAVGPTSAAFKAARAAVDAARARVKRVTAAPDAAAIATATAELAKAKSDLATLTKPATRPLQQEIDAVNRAIALAIARLAAAQLAGVEVDIRSAQFDLDKAKSDLALLERAPVAPLPEEIAAAQAAVAGAEQRLARTSQPFDAADIALAVSDLDRALADEATLAQKARTPLPAELASAREAVNSARARLAKARRPFDSADTAAAAAELERALSDLATLKRGQLAPLPAVVAGARQAVTAARVRLARLGYPTPGELAVARAEVRKAEADLDVLRARGGPASATDIALARIKVRDAGRRLDAARDAFRALVVRAPRTGTVTSVLTVVGAPVDGTTPVVAVSNRSRVEVAVDLSEFDIAQVRLGLKASVAVDAFGGRVIPGRVRFAAPTGTNQNGVVTFPVRVALVNTSGLRPGMNVSVRIVVANKRNVVQVPQKAVARNDEGQPFVNVLAPDGSIKERKVKLGLSSATAVEVLSGLAGRERVILAEVAGSQEEE